MQLTDPYHLKARRRKMVEALAFKGIHDQRVLKAMEQLPRHFFVESIFAEKAYEDKALPIEVDQTISQPFTVAFQSALLDVQTNHKILEIGTGSGYQAAVLALLGAKVFTVERQSVLYHKTKTLLETLGMHAIKCYHKDGTNGLSTQQPYDGIIVTAGAPVVPEALKQQLKIGGRLVIPVGASTQTMLLITRIDKNQFTREEKGTFQFVPFLKGIQS